MRIVIERAFFALLACIAYSEWQGVASAATPVARAACVTEPEQLCLSERFVARVTWHDRQGHTGTGQAVHLTGDTGYFWFFSPENIELGVKVLDGRTSNGHWWLFYGALSDVEYTLTVTDTATGTTRTYFNPAGRLASVGDTRAFAERLRRPGPLSLAMGSQREELSATNQGGGCVPTATSLCLSKSRFRVEVSWKTSSDSGVGMAEGLTADSGYFWFSDKDNVELIVKVLDGRAMNDHWWVFYGALSKIEYTITVTDTATGRSKAYANPSGRLSSRGDISAFSEHCEGPCPFEYAIDNAVNPNAPSLPGLDGGPPRAVAVMVGPDGKRDEFVVNEVVFRPQSQTDLDAFLNRYGGTVLRDGTPLIISESGVSPASPVESNGTYLIRVDPDRSSLADIAGNMAAAGLGGRFVFSSEDAARLAALLAREAPLKVSLNVVLHSKQCTVCEHPDYGGGYLDAAKWKWMTEDDDLVQSGVQGLSIGVVHAWDYLSYLGVPPPAGGTTYSPRVAIIDGGFDLDEETGIPLNGNIDYYNSFDAPLQGDVVERDGTAGGINSLTCTGGSSCPWHGQGVFGVAAAYPRNGFGSAGTGGAIVRPMLIKVDAYVVDFGPTTGIDIQTGIYLISLAVRSAALSSADVINMSVGGNCGWLCQEFGGGDILQAEVGFARNLGVINVAAAGNEGRLIENDIPCKLHGVICVGGITETGHADSDSNFGPEVDIWAPYCLRSTMTRDSAASDADDLGVDELEGGADALLCGTSFSSPFVAGIVGLMKALDRSLEHETVEAILQNTANPSTDSKVTPGYVDAYRAVAKVKLNQPPTIHITTPAGDGSVSWGARVSFHADVHDPEPGGLRPGSVAVVFSSDRDGQLCTATGGPTDYGCEGPRLSPGAHVITATATDLFGAKGQSSIALKVINQPPIAEITYPPTGSTYYTSQIINFRGFGFDFDESIPETNLFWRSNLDGALGTGSNITKQLTEGAHTVTLTAIDGLGLSGTKSITVTVLVGPGHPTAQILSPQDRSFFLPGTLITLKGKGTDPEDGVLSGSSLSWSSSINGFLGTGSTIAVVLSGPEKPCKPEFISHKITLQVVDRDGHQATHEIEVLIGNVC